MSFEKIVEDQIRKAIAEGEFENLQGKGKPLDLESYFQTPEHLRMAYSILKNGAFVPEEVQLMSEIDAAQEERRLCADEQRAGQLEREIRVKRLSLSVLLERYHQRR
ncbi:MAG: DUF1992 domain-containing protein [Acidobacteria bacterium]|nr:DUF1992 domain-containing protein [Acidobacteriota bacterium]MCI0621864.1 DUF1992 domain-containing protein [Acidobacteriota bacterium]MCI0717786.1 DUF1992 domain-containing protein [Acidobacteriota bacterium]